MYSKCLQLECFALTQELQKGVLGATGSLNLLEAENHALTRPVRCGSAAPCLEQSLAGVAAVQGARSTVETSKDALEKSRMIKVPASNGACAVLCAVQDLGTNIPSGPAADTKRKRVVTTGTPCPPRDASRRWTSIGVNTTTTYADH